MSIYEELCEKITQQQKGNDGTDVFAVGEQLKDICRGNDHFSDIVLTDLENKDMTLEKAAQKIRDFAKQHKNGNFGFCGPADADRILRKFYGLPAEDAPVQDRPKKVDLLDFI